MEDDLNKLRDELEHTAGMSEPYEAQMNGFFLFPTRELLVVEQIFQSNYLQPHKELHEHCVILAMN